MSVCSNEVFLEKISGVMFTDVIEIENSSGKANLLDGP